MIIGIDPGLHGAVAFYTPSSLHVADMPTFTLARGGKTRLDIDTHGLYRLLLDSRIATVYVEQVGAMPGQGVSSVFAFGKGFGIILGILAALGVPYNLVPPQRWKKALQVPAAKDGARARASQLLPAHTDKWKLVKHDGRAEAVLLALYGHRLENGHFASPEKLQSPQPLQRGN
jgi:crossover junction endodeoxyribonuclease RuvC